MRRLTAMFVAFLSLVLGGAAAAQDFSGTYAAQAGAGPGLTLVLRQTPQGQVTGTLTGRMQFQILEQKLGGQVTVYAVAPGGLLFLHGLLQLGGIVLALA